MEPHTDHRLRCNASDICNLEVIRKLWPNQVRCDQKTKGALFAPPHLSKLPIKEIIGYCHVKFNT